MERGRTTRRRLLHPPAWVLALVPPPVFAALAWVFLSGREDSVPAYVLYGLSAYALAIWATAGKCERRWVRLTKSESKYFATAAKMDEAFLALLAKKDFAYITVKEICAAAGVNRSTFYLHYETLSDLLEESAALMNRRFLDYMQHDSAAFIAKLRDCPLEELYLITPEYLTPYLRYVRENQRLFRTALENASALHLEDSYAGLLRHVITPILDRFDVPQQDRPYLMAFYMQGLMAILSEWLKNDCADPIEHIIAVIRRCVKRREEEP